ncbi:MAG: hypothetical protein K6A62_08540 [Bacteroidales bacterium]|nr:hypothetical protein [Bacteroidales bacterium]
MGLNVTGLDANGRITPKGSNIVIPPESAGIGDLIFKNGSTVKVIARGTASGTTISIGGSSYTLYGCIYGFVNGEAMVVAPNAGETSATWGSYPSGAPTYGEGTPLMRNGNRTSYYAQMNTATNQSYITGGGSAPVTLASAYHATSLNASNFDGSASADIKKRYGTWWEYIRQTLRVNGAPGTPFGAVGGGCKVHEFGRWMGKTYFSSSSYPAGYHCYTYNEGGGTWWLPSMFELAELMIDEHLDKINENSGILSVSAGANRWSCVLFSSGLAWVYDYYGLSGHGGFGNSFTVRPVTLLKLV